MTRTMERCIPDQEEAQLRLGPRQGMETVRLLYMTEIR